MKCPFCKLELPEDSLFCQYCGKEIDFDMVAAQEKEEVDKEFAVGSISESIIDNHVFCTKCGMRFEGAFCPVCGEPAVVKTEEFNAAAARINQTAAYMPTSTIKTKNAPIEEKKIITNTTEVSKIPKKHKKWGKKQWIISAGAFICAVLLFFAGCYFYSLGQIDRYNYKTAEKWFSCIPAGNVLFPNASKYIGISKQLDAENYDSAITTLSSLGNFRNAVAVKGDVVNKKIDGMISSGKYTEAIKYLSSNSPGLVNAATLLKKTYYEWGNQYEAKGEYFQAYQKMQHATGYSAADNKISNLKELAYKNAIAEYRRGNHAYVKSHFDGLDGYKDSEIYDALVSARNGYANDSQYRLLIDNVDFEDANKALLNDGYISKKFLSGTWKGDDRYFKMKDSGQISYDIPGFNYGNHYYINDGDVVLADGDGKKTLFSITVVSEDCIKVLAHKNNKTYTLYRQ